MSTRTRSTHLLPLPPSPSPDAGAGFPAPVRLVVFRHERGIHRVSRPGMGRSGPRRPPAVRIPDPGGGAGRSQLVDDPAQARGLPRIVCRLRPGEGGAFRRAQGREAAAVPRHRAQPTQGGVGDHQCTALPSGAAGIRQLRAIQLAVRRRQADREPLARDVTGAGDVAGVGCVQQGPAAARLQVRGFHDHVRAHAGDRHGERSRGDVFQARGSDREGDRG